MKYLCSVSSVANMSIPWLVFVSFSIVLVSFTSSQLSNSTDGLSDAQVEDLRCDAGWYPFEEFCYSLGSAWGYLPLPWGKAKRSCYELGGILASIHSEELNYYLEVYMLNRVKNFVWIGLRGNKQPPRSYYGHVIIQYSWEDQRSINYTNWADEEIDVEEICLAMDFVTENWRRKSCNENHEFICQRDKRAFSESSMSSHTDPRLCKDGSWKKESSCFYLNETPLTWYEAEEHCVKAYRGHLATVLDSTTNSLLHYVFSDQVTNAWLGIKINCTTFQQKWSSGWFVSYSNWGTAEPSECTAFTKDSRWLSVSCSTELPFICETSSVSPPMMTPSSLKGGHCPKIPKRWRDLGGEKCYHFETENRVPWQEANFQCLRMGGTLASIHSGNEIEVLNQFVVENSYIGLHRSAGHGESFMWSDGTPVDYINWSENEPNDAGEECVEMSEKDSRWSDIECSKNRSYICSVQKIVTQKMVKETESHDDSAKTYMVKKTESHEVEASNNLAKERESHKGGFSVMTLLGAMFGVLGVCILFGITAHFYQCRVNRRVNLPYQAQNNQYEHIMLGNSKIESSGVSS